MRSLASEASPAPGSLGAGTAPSTPAPARAWQDLYRRAPRDAALARDLLAQLDLDPVARSAHLALYVLSQEAIRRGATRRARMALILKTRLAHALRAAWKRWRSGAATATVARPWKAPPHRDAAPMGADIAVRPPVSDIGTMTQQQMEAELLDTTLSPDAASCQSQSCRSAGLERRLEIARALLLVRLEQQLRDGPCIASPQALRDWLCMRYAGLDHEVLMVLFLDAQHRLISADQMFRGTLTETAVYPREIVKAALLKNAAAVAMVHNHPSAALEPSPADQLLTKRVSAALELIHVKLIDHFVVAGSRMVSMAQRGLL